MQLFGNKEQDLENLASETPIGSPDALTPPNSASTSCMNFSIQTQLGWITWKESECALYRYYLY